MEYEIFKQPRYNSYLLSNKTPVNFEIKVFKNMKLKKRFTDLENEYSQRMIEEKSDYDFFKKKFTKEEFISYERINFMDMTKIFQKMKYIEKKYNIGPGFTNAWRKMYEICEKTDIISKRDETVKHFDICGSPGAFVLGMNHFMKTKRRNQNYDWYIQSYTGEGGLKDSYGLYRKYPSRFLEGPQKGDISSPKSVRYYRDFFKNNKRNLVTSDCGQSSVDVWENIGKNTREKQMLKIFYGQFICSLSVLSKGGNLFMKSYTSFSKFSVSLVYLMCCFFKKVRLVKPISSRYPEKNEIYYLCNGMVEELSDTDFDDLINILENWNGDMFEKNIGRYTSMDKKLVSNIQDKMSDFYEERLNDYYEKEETIREIVGDKEENPKIYLSNLKKLQDLTSRETIKFANHYVKKMGYKKIKTSDRLI